MELPREKRPHLGYIPMGTANDVANTLGLPMRQPQQAVVRILGGEPLDYDVGEILGVGYSTSIAAFGAFTEVSYKTDQDLKKALGHRAYVIEAVPWTRDGEDGGRHVTLDLRYHSHGVRIFC